jgi:2-oxoglutarate ferredoxin oxidoreductase subunit alpha
MIKWNSIEHNPSGTRTDNAEEIVTMKDKRNRKTIGLHEATKEYQRIAVHGDSGTPVFAYGSTVLELREAQKHCKTPFRIIALIYLLPLPIAELNAYRNEAAIVVEHSSTGFLCTYLQQNLQLQVKENILRYDGRPYDPIELAGILEGALNA